MVAKQGDGMVTSSTTVWSQDGSQHDCVVARRSNAVVAKQGDGMVTGQHDFVVVRRSQHYGVVAKQSDAVVAKQRYCVYI